MISQQNTKKVEVTRRGRVETYTLVDPIELGRWDGLQAYWACVEEYDESGLVVVGDEEFSLHTDLYLAICHFGSYGMYNLVYCQEHAMDIPALKTFAYKTYQDWGIE